jgi:DNA-binding NarL/FixJ family response regulator
VSLRLVLIEDHQALREGLELLLSLEGCEVVGTPGDAASDPALVERERPDVALVDIRLGEDDGIAHTRTLLDADPERRSCSTPARPTRSSCSAGWTPARRATRSRRARRASSSARSSSWRRAGLRGEQVAERLVLSAETIKTHIRNAMSKLEAHTRVHTTATGLREGFISPPADAGVARG